MLVPHPSEPVYKRTNLRVQLATEAAWGTIWTRPGLELKQRSLIVIALLMSMGKEAEVGVVAFVDLFAC
jgi:alkylhydroperoxidase/carboxymuconolactone decarboxylase family protein YurZ